MDLDIRNIFNPILSKYFRPTGGRIIESCYCYSFNPSPSARNSSPVALFDYHGGLSAPDSEKNKFNFRNLLRYDGGLKIENILITCLWDEGVIKPHESI